MLIANSNSPRCVQISRVTPYLYLSAATALTPAALAQLRPSLVVNVTPDLPLVPDTASLR